MWPTEAQRLRLVCSATIRAPSRIFSKSRLESPWPWVTMQKRWAPAASAALACSRICSGSIIACIGVSASAKRDWAQKPQSSAQPPDFALTSEHMSVLSPNSSCRASQARSTSARISSWSSISPRRTASSREMSGGIVRHSRHGSGRDAASAGPAWGMDLPRRSSQMDGSFSRRSSEVGMVKCCSPTDDVEYVAAADPIRVLLCDDAEGFRALMRSSLADDPSIEIVGEAADGVAGVEATAELQPDVVLLDMSMPRMGGLQAIPKMRRRAPGTSIIGLSSLSAARMAAPSIEIGAHTYLEKGTGLEDIRAAIHAAVDR